MLDQLSVENDMRILQILLRQFRNIHSQEISFHQPVIVFTGDNGQGKTNLLESIYYAATLKSFRKHPSKMLIEKGYSSAQIQMSFLHDHIEKELQLQIQNESKTILLNKKILTHLQDFMGLIPIIAFIPDDLMILKGDPSQRRDFIDRALFTSFPNYLFEFRQYQRLLKQRNSLLKDLQVDRQKELFETFTEQLAVAGGIIIQRRLEFLQMFLPELQKQYLCFGKTENVDHILRDIDIAYLSKGISYPTEKKAEDYSHLLLEKLQKTKSYDEKLKYTSTGPHSDDFRFLLSGNDTKSFASQGQMRLLILMLKLALVSFVKKHRKISPILLLDDVASELDPLVQTYLFGTLSEMQCQVFLTTTSLQNIPLLQSQKYQVYLVAYGQTFTQ